VEYGSSLVYTNNMMNFPHWGMKKVFSIHKTKKKSYVLSPKENVKPLLCQMQLLATHYSLAYILFLELLPINLISHCTVLAVQAIISGSQPQAKALRSHMRL